MTERVRLALSVTLPALGAALLLGAIVLAHGAAQ